jgi:hypothetical protein
MQPIVFLTGLQLPGSQEMDLVFPDSRPVTVTRVQQLGCSCGTDCRLTLFHPLPFGNTSMVHTYFPTAFFAHLNSSIVGHEMSSSTRTLGSWIRIPLKAWILVSVYSEFVLSRGLATG